MKRKLIIIIAACMIGISNAMNGEVKMVNEKQSIEQQEEKD